MLWFVGHPLGPNGGRVVIGIGAEVVTVTGAGSVAFVTGTVTGGKV